MEPLWNVLFAVGMILLYIIEIPLSLLIVYLLFRYVMWPILFWPLILEEWWTGKRDD